MLRDAGSARLDVLLAAWAADLDRQRSAGECAEPIDAARLARVATGEATPAEAAPVREHLARCLPCLNAYTELVTAVDDDVAPELAAWEGGAFIGRAAELRALVAGLERSVAGERQVVCVAGPPGIGKSRLLGEFRYAAQDRGARVIRARCSPLGARTPYQPLLELFQGLCRFGDLDPADTVRDRLDAAVRTAGLDAHGTVPFAAQLARRGTAAGAGLIAEPSVMKQKLAEILAAVVLRASHDQPIVLEIEDLQWCDPASAECLGRLVAGLGAARVLVVVTSRPSYRAEWLDAAGATTLDLPPLSSAEARTLLGSLGDMAALADGAADEIVAKADGNPLMLEELALAVRTLGRADDVVTVPSEGSRLLRLRVAALPDDARRVLQRAAVLGLQAPLDLLGAVATLGATARELTLERLEEDGFLVTMVEGDARRVRFRHALIQEVVYDDIEPAERRRLHGEVARALETRAGTGADGATETLAHHFALSPDDDKAIDYALQAAGQMIRRAANAEAMLALDTALDRLTRMPDTPANQLRRIDVVLAQAEARFGLGQHAEHIQALRGVEALVAQVGDARRQATWHYWLGFLHSLTGGRPDASIEHCRMASTIADAAGIEDIYAFSESCLAQVLSMAGELREAMDAGKRALSIFESGGNTWWCCRTLWFLASAALALGQWRESVAFCERALEHGRAVSDSRLMAVAWLRLGAAHVHRGEWETGVDCCNQAEQLTHTAFDTAMLKVNRGYGLVRGGQHAAGIASIGEGLDWFQRAGLRYSQLIVEIRLAEAHLRAGDAAVAVTLSRETLASSRELGYRHVEGMALAILGAALSGTAGEEAGSTLATAADVLEEVGALNDLARVKVAQARLAEGAGDRMGSANLLRSALRLFEALGTLDEAARVRTALAAR
jgi:tetratricopeptide (TPR) repeat protein